MDHSDHSGHDHGSDSKTTDAPTMSNMEDMAMTTAAASAAASKDAASASASASAAAGDHSGHAGHGTTNDADADTAHMMMSPFLFTRKTGFFVLFREALVNSTGGFIGALFACFAFGALTSIGMELGKRIENRARDAKIEGGAKALPLSLLGALAHGFSLLLHYIAMLLVMTMSVWIILAVVLGHAVGFLFVVNFIKDTARRKKFESNSKESGSADADGAACC